MGQYLFGFRTFDVHDSGELLAAGDGDDVARGVQKNLENGFVRMGRLIEPLMTPVDMVPPVVRKAEKIEPPKAAQTENKPLEKKRRP